MVALVLDGLVGFAAGLSPTSFHLSPSSFHVSRRLGACGRVRGWLVSHFFSFVSQFFSFVSQAGCLWSGSRPACLPLLFICLPVLFICLPGWVLVVGFPAGFVSQAGCLWSGSRPACLPLLFPVLTICLPGWVLLVGFPAGLSPTSFHLSPKLGACGRVPAWLVSHFFSFVSQFFSFVSQAGRLWSGSFVSHSFSFVSQAGCGGVPGWLVSHFFSFVPQGACLWSACGRVPGWLVSHFLSFSVLVLGFPARLSPTSLNVSPTSFHLFPRLGACGPVPGWLVSHFLAFVSHFLLFVSRVSCLLYLSLLISALFCWPCSISIHVPGLSLLVSALAFLFFCLAGLSLVCPCVLAMKHVYSFVCHVRHCWCHVAFICFPGPLLLLSALFRWPCSISIHLSPRSVTAGVRPFSAGDATFLFICFPGLSLRPPFSAGHAAFLFICFPGLSLVLPPFSAGHVAFLFIYLPCDFFLFVFQVWCLHCCFLPCPLEQVRV